MLLIQKAGGSMKAMYKVGDLIGLPVWIGQFRSEKIKTGLVTEVRKWAPEHRPWSTDSWDYLVLMSDGQEIMLDHEVLLANPKLFFLLEAA